MLAINKRGNLQDPLYIMAVLFAVAVVVVIIYAVWTGLRSPLETALTDSIGNQSVFNVTSFYDQTTGGLEGFDVAYPFIIVGLLAGTLISAFFIRSHPIFFFIGIVAILLFLVIAAVFGNSYEQIIGTSDLAAAASHFTIMTVIMKNLPAIVLIITAIVVIVLVSKRPSAGGGL